MPPLLVLFFSHAAPGAGDEAKLGYGVVSDWFYVAFFVSSITVQGFFGTSTGWKMRAD